MQNRNKRPSVIEMVKIILPAFIIIMAGLAIIILSCTLLHYLIDIKSGDEQMKMFILTLSVIIGVISTMVMLAVNWPKELD